MNALDQGIDYLIRYKLKFARDKNEKNIMGFYLIHKI